MYLGPVQISKYFLGFLKISKDSKRSSVVLIQILLSHNNLAQKFLSFARLVVCLFFLPVEPGTTAGLCVGDCCPVIEPVGDCCPVIEPVGNGCPVVEPVGNGCPVIEPVGNGCPVIEPVVDGCPVIEPVVDSVWEAMLIILHSFNEMVVFT